MAKKITVYTTTSCSFCTAAKRLLAQRQLSYDEVDLSHNQALRQQLSAANGGYRTVPMIFIGEAFVGGYQELASLDREGRLLAMVQGA